MAIDLTIARDAATTVAVFVTAASAVFAALTYYRSSRVQSAQFVANLSRDLLATAELRQFYFHIDYEKFRFDSSAIAAFKGSDDERRLVALLYQYNMIGRLIQMGVVSYDDIDFLVFEVIQVLSNTQVQNYLAWLDAEFSKHGRIGPNARKRPFHDARWILDDLSRRS